MRVLWLSCLLIGAVTCGPLGKGYRSNSADTSFIQQPASSGYGFSGPGVSSDPGSSSPLPSLPNLSSGTAAAPPALHYPTFNTGYSSYGGSPNAYNSPNMGEAYYGGYANFRDDNRPTGVDHGAFYGGYHSGVYGYGDSYGNVGSSYDENRGSESATGYGAGEENPEPVFSDVSDLEPVYSFSSRSRYQRGSAVFAQTRYSPGEFYPPEQEYAPAKAQTKGGF